jgi:hypothetical protein
LTRPRRQEYNWSEIRRTWKKDCSCQGFATMPGTYMSWERSGRGWDVKVVWHDGPVCDNCNKPWREVAVNEGSISGTEDV